jgi:hypothetical protein
MVTEVKWQSTSRLRYNTAQYIFVEAKNTFED